MKLRGRNRRRVFNRTKARWTRASPERLRLARSAWRSFGPARACRGGLAGVVKLSPHMGQAAREHDLVATAPGKAVVGFVAVALDGAAEVHGDDVLQARGRAACLPVEDDVSARNASRVSF